MEPYEVSENPLVREGVDPDGLDNTSIGQPEPSPLDLQMDARLRSTREIACFPEYLDEAARDFYARVVDNVVIGLGEGELAFVRLLGLVAPLSPTGDALPEFVEQLAGALNLLVQKGLAAGGVLGRAMTFEVVPYGVRADEIDGLHGEAICEAFAASDTSDLCEPAVPTRRARTKLRRTLAQYAGRRLVRRGLYLVYAGVPRQFSNEEVDAALGALWCVEEGGFPRVGIL